MHYAGEAKAWHYPPEVKFADEDFDEEDLRVSLHSVLIACHLVDRIESCYSQLPLYTCTCIHKKRIC